MQGAYNSRENQKQIQNGAAYMRNGSPINTQIMRPEYKNRQKQKRIYKVYERTKNKIISHV